MKLALEGKSVSLTLAYAALSSIVLCTFVWATEFVPGLPHSATLLMTMLGVLVVAIRFGRIASIVGSLAAAVTYAYFFEPPFHQFAINSPEGWITVVTLLIAAIIASQLAITAEERAAEAMRSRLETERLYDFGQALLSPDNSQALACVVVEELVHTFKATGSAFRFASDGQLHRAGPDGDLILLGQLVEATERATLIVDPTGGCSVIPVGLGQSRPLASFGAVNTTMSPIAMRAVAHIAGTALERVRHGEEILRLAREIQMGFLPKGLPPFAAGVNLEVFAYIKPMYEVGGDFYTLAPMNDRQLFFSIGDVADKGFPAALFMSRAVTAFDISVGPYGGVQQSVTAVNKTLCSNNDSQMFATALAAVIDASTGEVEYCDGGHEPPFVLRAGGRVEEVQKKDGLALGFLRDYVYQTERLTLEPGDTLIFYTDGITEAMSETRELFGAERIRSALAENHIASAEGIGRALLEHVERFVGAAPQSDDRTVLIVRYVPQPTDLASAPMELEP